MIFSNLFASLMQLVFKPKIWIPLLGMLIISTATTLAMSFVLQGLILDVTIYSSVLEAQPVFSVLLTQYFFEILLVLVLTFFMSVLGVISFMSTSRIAQGESLVKAINKSMNEYQKALGIALVFWGVFILMIFLGTILSLVARVNEIIAIALVGILFVVLVVVLVKTVFTLPALNKNELRNAIKSSWTFTNNKFWKSTGYLLLVGIILIIFGSIFYQIELIIQGHVIELIVLALFETFPSLFFISAITNYFYSKQ
ncbi:MAG: glycerophosphoryl diester phosphodiesterase membrane domain-containing protein [Candidatus Iainarchaeum sp.]|jgi:hypothetical protein|nr:MAG: Membrane domain of glycerophosphoryl diester phosphodiesterase [archaeon ADurb.Bin336]